MDGYGADDNIDVSMLPTAPSPGLCGAEPELSGTESWDLGPYCDAPWAGASQYLVD